MRQDYLANEKALRLPEGRSVAGWMPVANMLPYFSEDQLGAAGSMFYDVFLYARITARYVLGDEWYTYGYYFHRGVCKAALMVNVRHSTPRLEERDSDGYVTVEADNSWINLWVDWNLPITAITRTLSRGLQLRAPQMHVLEVKNLHALLFESLDFPDGVSIEAIEKMIAA